MDYLMGIDLGSTSLKAIVYDLDGNRVASGSRPTEKVRQKGGPPEWTVWEPEQIWTGTAAAIHDAVDQLDDPRQLRGVAVTGMGMDGVPIDESGQWLYPFISWHDPRTAEQYEWWLANIGAEKVFSIGGNPLWPINSVLRILWMAQHEPEILDRTSKWLLIEDFLNFMLCGNRVTDYSMASCTALFDQKTLTFSDELLKLSGIDGRLLCDAKPSGTLIGEVHSIASEATGLPIGTPVVLGGHDHICGALPVGVIQPGVVLDVTGTWESVLTTTETPVLKDELRQSGITVQSHVARGKYTAWGGNPAGEMLEWYRAQFGGEAARRAEVEGGVDWDYLIATAEATEPGAGRVMFLPHMSGASCPVVDPQSRGAFVGLTNRTTDGDMLRAIFEGLDYQFLDIVTSLEVALETKLERFIAVGGATRNTFWMQNKADVVGRPVEVPEVEEATPLGAAILAGIGLGLYCDEAEAYQRVSRPGRTFEPDPKRHAQYAEWFDTYRQLYHTMQSIHHRLASVG